MSLEWRTNHFWIRKIHFRWFVFSSDSTAATLTPTWRTRPTARAVRNSLADCDETLSSQICCPNLAPLFSSIAWCGVLRSCKPSLVPAKWCIGRSLAPPDLCSGPSWRAGSRRPADGSNPSRESRYRRLADTLEGDWTSKNRSAGKNKLRANLYPVFAIFWSRN